MSLTSITRTERLRALMDRDGIDVLVALKPENSFYLSGFNPIIYPDLKFTYRVNVTALQGNQFKISVDLDQPLPSAWIGKVGFNLELFPGELFGKAFLMAPLSLSISPAIDAHAVPGGSVPLHPSCW